MPLHLINTYNNLYNFETLVYKKIRKLQLIMKQTPEPRLTIHYTHLSILTLFLDIPNFKADPLELEVM